MNRRLFASAALLLALCGTAKAEVGKASASPGEWFLGLSAGGGATWGAERQSFLKADPGGPKEVNFDDGTFFTLGLELGYVLEDSSFLFDRVELATELRGQTRSFTRNPRGAGMTIVDPPLQAVVALGGPFTQVDSDEDELDAEVRLNFKKTVADNDSSVIVASFEPFYRRQDTNSESKMFFTAISPFSALRRDTIDADYYGAQAAVEMEAPLSESMSFIGRASAGAYYVDADTETAFDNRTFGIELAGEDSDSTWGGRFGGALGIKVPLHYAGASITLMGTVDYLTDVATIQHADSQGKTTESDFDDALDIGGRFGLVIPLR